MIVEGKTKEELVNELAELQKRMAELEISDVERKRLEEELTQLITRAQDAHIEAEAMRAALVQSEACYRAIGETIPYGVWICDTEGGVIYLSENFLNLVGMTLEQCKQFGWTSKLPSEDVDKTLADWKHCIETGSFWDYEHSILGVDGCYHTILSRGIPIRDAEGCITSWAGINLDITERKRAEEELQRAQEELEIRVQERTAELAKANDQLRVANRALKVLSECNQTLVHVTQEADLLREICRIIVETGGYRLAWVGLAQQDEEKTVHPVAQAGYEDGYLDTLGITWSDTERGHGPTGTAIRTGNTCVCKNIPTDPNFIPWCEEAMRRRYASSIAVPMVAEGHILGALNIYAVEPDAFDEEEVKLLTELADDLAFGISALRTRNERERAENARRESEGKFRSLAEKSLVGIYLLQDGFFKYVNPRMAGIFGYQPDEMIDKMMTKDAVFEEDWPMVEENIRKRIAGETRSIHYEARAVTKDKEIIFVEVYGSAIEYEGRPAVIGTLLDVTERKLVGEALRLSEEKYRTMVEQSNDMIWTLDTEGVFTFWNQRCEEISGYRFEDWQGKSFEPLILEEYMPWVLEAFRRTLEGEPQHYEVALRKNDGDILLLSVNSAPIFVGHEVVGTVSFGRDVTEQKRSEQKLREERDRTQEYFDVAGVAFVVIDANETVTAINRKGCEILGYQQDEIVGRSWFDNFVPERLRDEVKDVFRKLMAGEIEPVEYFENPVLTKNGEERAIAWHNTVLRNAKGETIATLGSGEDITKQRQAEEKLKMEAQLLDAATESIVLHDLEGNLVYLNEAAYKLRGYTRDELMRMNLRDLDTPECAELVGQRIKELVDTGEAVFESANFRKDGSVMPVEVHARIIESGGRKLILGVSSDISERKKAEGELQNSLDKLQKALSGTIQVIALTVESKDPYTAGHQRRVAELACTMGKEIGLSISQIEGIRMAGVIHDIGKITIPGEILSKPGPLSNIEMSLIRNHPLVAYEILKTVEFPWPVAQTVLQHHERINGSGYPTGISGDDIILEAKILAVADVVEAMSSHRPYRPALSIDQALEEISKNKGILYDPQVVEACLRLFSEKAFSFDQDNGNFTD